MHRTWGDLNERLLAKGWIEADGEQFRVTASGKAVGGKLRISKQFGPFILWPKDVGV